jgi:hypothetical protein
VQLVDVVKKKIEIPYGELREIVEKSGITPGMETTSALRRLTPYRGEVLAFVYRRIVEISRAHGALPVLVFMPPADEGNWQAYTPETMRLAEEAGFLILDLQGMYDGHSVDTYVIADWDRHPNDKGHKLIADRLFQELDRHRDRIFGSR